MCVQSAGLLANRLNHTWIAMFGVWDTVVTIKILAPVCIPKPNAFAFYEVDWILVKSGYI